MAPEEGSPELEALNKVQEVPAGDGRSPTDQAIFQIVALIVTLGFALVGGLIVGLTLRICPFLGQPSGERLFEDSLSWHVPPESNSAASADSHEAGDPAADASRAPLFAGHMEQGDMTLEEKSFMKDEKV